MAGLWCVQGLILANLRGWAIAFNTSDFDTGNALLNGLEVCTYACIEKGRESSYESRSVFKEIVQAYRSELAKAAHVESQVSPSRNTEAATERYGSKSDG
jgi:hypothetical protein